MLEKMIDFVYGALIFLILVGIAFAVYQIFWAKTLTVAEQNFDSIFAELNELGKGNCFDVVVRPSSKAYTLALYAGGNSFEGCSGEPCLCLGQSGLSYQCKVIPNTGNDCKRGFCVIQATVPALTIVPDVPVVVAVCSSENNELSIIAR